MKICACQFDCDLDNISYNIDKIVQIIHKAKATNCDMVILPEMADTGYDMKIIRQYASPWSKNTPYDIIRKTAKKCNIKVICGLSERTPESIFNSTLICNNDGQVLGAYRKIHTFDAHPIHENKTITPGNSFLCLDINGIRFGFLICYDIRFPEAARVLALLGAQVIVIIAAFPFPRLKHWETLTSCRAIENQAYLIASNRVGTDNALTFCGSSRIIDPYGIIVSSASESTEEIIEATIDISRVTLARNTTKIFDQRQPHLYKEIIN